MKTLLLTCFIAFGFLANAQNWRLVNPNRTSFYQNVDLIHSIKIDSVKQNGSDSIFYNYKIWDYVDYWGSCIETRDTNFLIDNLTLKPNGDQIIFNKDDDSILIKDNSTIGFNWTIYAFPNGNKLKATLSSILPVTILASIDSIKTIQLQATDNLGVPISHLMNGKEIKVSKNNGLIKFYNTLDFPNDTIAFNLVGKSNPDIGITNLTYGEINDWDIGDVFHYYGSWNNTSGDAMDEYELITITGKSISITGDSITYTKDRKYYQKNYNWPNIQVNYSQSTPTETMINSAFNYINKLSYEPHIDTTFFSGSGFTFQYENSAFPGKRMKKGAPHYWYMNPCFSNGIGQCIFYEYDYLEGIGLFLQDNGGGPFCYVKSLVYYSKGTETWGTPIDWQTLLSTDDIESKSNISIYPNPSNGTFTISPSENISAIEITNSLGQIIYHSKNSQSNFKEIDLSNQANGIYFVKIINVNEEYSFSKLIKE